MWSFRKRRMLPSHSLFSASSPGRVRKRGCVEKGACGAPAVAGRFGLMEKPSIAYSYWYAYMNSKVGQGG